MNLEDLINARGREFWIDDILNIDRPSVKQAYIYEQDTEKFNGKTIHVTEAAHADKLRAALLVAVEALDKNLSQRTRGYPTPKEWEENWIICNEAKKKIKEIMEWKS